MRTILGFLVLSLALLTPTLASADPPTWRVGVTEGWAIVLPNEGQEMAFTPGSFRIGLSAGWRVNDSPWSLSVKPRLVIPHTGFRPNPGLIVGVGRKLSDTWSWTAGLVYQLNLPYEGADLGQLLSLGSGPVWQITPSVAIAPSIAIGKSVDGPWSIAVQPLELLFTLP